MSKKQSLINKRFGRLLVLEELKERKNKKIVYLCKCDCGTVKTFVGANLTKGDTSSCGCFKKEKAKKHGMSNDRLYRIWAGIIQRCSNSKEASYKHYGGRGITFSPEWIKFANFKDWALSNGYSDRLSIDRIDVNGNYEPNNCRWATKEEQNNNRRTNIFVEVHEETMTLIQLSRKYNLSYGMLQHRYNLGERGEKLIEPQQRGIKRNGEIKRPKFLSLDRETVGEIKWLINNTNLFQSQIGNIYGVSQSMVGKIKSGQFHNDIEEIKPIRMNYYEQV